MLKIVLSSLIAMASWQAWATPTPEQPDRNEGLYNLQGNLGLKGFDPVAYFEEFGGQALAGDPNITAEYGNVVYRFASEDNRDAFLSNPTRFEPTYGGWCAWARANGEYANFNPRLFTQSGENRMHFFISPSAKFQFDADLEMYEGLADISWEEESGEAPRL